MHSVERGGELEYDVSTKQIKLPEGSVAWPLFELSHFRPMNRIKVRLWRDKGNR